jgi:hypothetical protein
MNDAAMVRDANREMTKDSSSKPPGEVSGSICYEANLLVCQQNVPPARFCSLAGQSVTIAGTARIMTFFVPWSLEKGREP